MNMEIADRLYQYRKTCGLSQEGLAERIGVSRQAVSKWERGEASPDTDNLIALARVFSVSLDEMILGSTQIPENKKSGSSPEDTEKDTGDEPAYTDKKENEKTDGESDRDHVSFQNGIHIHAKNGDKVDIDPAGVHVEDHRGESVHVGWNGVYVNEEVKHPGREKTPLHRFFNRIPYPLLTVIAYLLFGFFNIAGGWAFGWLVFLTIPLYYTAVSAVFHRNPMHFAYPVLVAAVYLWCGFFYAAWHPMWVLFITIPLYYSLCRLLMDFRRKP